MFSPSFPLAHFLVLCGLAVTSVLVKAQSYNFTADPSWQNPNITTPPEVRMAVAGAAIDTLLNQVGTNGLLSGADASSNFGNTATLYISMAEFDLATSGTRYQSQLKQNFAIIHSQNSNFTDQFLDRSLAYGYAAARAYAAYKDSDFLGYAITVWNLGQAFTISQSEADAGTMSTKNFTLASQCQGVTMAGATFRTTDPNDPVIFATSPGSHLINSALLAELTLNETYRDAATLAANFILSQLDRENTHLISDNMDGRANDKCTPASGSLPYNQGVFIEGLAVLSAITGNSTLQSLLLDAIAIVGPGKHFQKDGGILGDSVLVRGLTVAYNRSATNFQLRNYLKEFLGVQYNSVLGNSSQSPLGTLITLVDAINLQNDTAPSNGSQPNNGSQPSDGSGQSDSGHGDNHHSVTGPIVGGVVGGLCLLALLIGLYFLVRRRRKRQELADIEPRPTEPFPFTETSHYPDANLTQSHFMAPNRRVKSPPNQSDPRSSHSVSGLTAGSSPDTSSNSYSAGIRQPKVPPSTVSSSGVVPRVEEMPTSELVRVLNDRLQPERWLPDEVPPDYAGTGRSYS